MAKKTCPHCGTSMESSRTVCPNCRIVLHEKRSLAPWLIIGGIIVVIILVVTVLLMSPVPQPVPLSAPAITIPPTEAAGAAPQAPACIIAITGSKVPPSSIRLQIMNNQCSAGEISELEVSVNGEQKGTLATTAGSGTTFAGTSGTNSVVVVAKYASGAESIVYQNPEL
jgi:predicted nucleic acid-binding Zn ribbon protein